MNKMKSLAWGLGALFVISAVPARAQQYVPKGFCHLTSSQTGSAVGFSASADAACASGLPITARTVEICVEAQSVRYRDDGVAPTTTVGMLVTAGTCWAYAGTIAAIQFIAVTNGAVVDVSFYAGPQ